MPPWPIFSPVYLKNWSSEFFKTSPIHPDSTQLHPPVCPHPFGLTIFLRNTHFILFPYKKSPPFRSRQISHSLCHSVTRRAKPPKRQQLCSKIPTTESLLTTPSCQPQLLPPYTSVYRKSLVGFLSLPWLHLLSGLLVPVRYSKKCP